MFEPGVSRLNSADVSLSRAPNDCRERVAGLRSVVAEAVWRTGGSHFHGGPEFCSRMEQLEVQRQVTNASSPWQNGRVERHGQWVQDLLMQGHETRFVESDTALEVVACELVSQKSRFLHRGGYSPLQVVLGQSDTSLQTCCLTSPQTWLDSRMDSQGRRRRSIVCQTTRDSTGGLAWRLLS